MIQLEVLEAVPQLKQTLSQKQVPFNCKDNPSLHVIQLVELISQVKQFEEHTTHLSKDTKYPSIHEIQMV